MPLKKIYALGSNTKAMVIMDQLVCSGSSFLTTILLARYLGITAFGIYSSIILLLYLYLSISNSLIVAPFQVLLAHQPNQKNYISSLLLWQVVVSLFFIIATFGISILQITALAELQQHISTILFLITTFLLQDFLRKVFLALDKIKEALLIDVLTNTLQIALLAIAAITHRLDLSLSLWIMAATFIPSILLGLFFLKPVQPSLAELGYHAKKHIHTGKWLLLTAIVQWWANNLFVVASGLFIGIKALGALRLAQTLFGILNIFLQVYENYVLPTASRLFKESAQQLKQYLRNTTLKSLLLLLPVSIALIAFARQIFMLSGGQAYVEYAFALQGMVVLYLVIFIGYPIRMAIRVLLLNRDFFIAYIISLVFSLLAAKFLISHWGLTGVITGLIINQLLVLSYCQYILYRKKFMLWN